VQKCSSIVDVVECLCGAMVIHQKDGKSTESRSFEEPLWDFASKGSMRALVSVVLVFVSLPLCVPKLEHFTIMNSML
jgi:hypothetical protein